MKFFVFVTVRTSSSRLPQKCLLPIRSQRVIEHVIDRAKFVKGTAGVVVCTSTEPEDDILETIAKNKKVLCFRGSLKDKLKRYNDATVKFGADYVVLFDADDLFCDPKLNELAIEQIKEEPCDFLRPPADLATGAFDFCISAAAIKKACEIKDTDDTEMYEIYFSDPRRFKIRELKVSDQILFSNRVRLTLDYQEDLDFFRRVFDELKMDVNIVPLPRIMSLLVKRPEIAEINLFRHRDYLAKREIMKNTKRIKKISL